MQTEGSCVKSDIGIYYLASIEILQENAISLRKQRAKNQKNKKFIQ
jgi:hypothetical protein